MALVPADDHRHDLQPGEHEAFYFLFSSSDGKTHGFVRTLFDQDSVLELVALHRSGRTWAHQHRAPLPSGPVPTVDGSGPTLRLTCLEPWQTWHCLFQGTLQEIGEEPTSPADLDLTYTATNEPAHFPYGPYHQAQQDGWLSGHLHIGSETWRGELVCYRDHSWGQRPMGAAAGWTIASAPGHFYAAAAEMGDQQVCVGRFITPNGGHASIRGLRIAALDEGWRIDDPEAGWGPWQVQRLAPPLVAYLGLAGQEALRDGPGPHDLYRDVISPAVFTDVHGREAVGFWDQARRLQ